MRRELADLVEEGVAAPRGVGQAVEQRGRGVGGQEAGVGQQVAGLEARGVEIEDRGDQRDAVEGDAGEHRP